MSLAWLIFGLSGPVAQPLYQWLRSTSVPVIAVSRAKREHETPIEWRQGSLQAPPELPAQVKGIISLGPLDAFADWLPHSSIQTQRIIALGSASEIFKANSINRYDRDVAGRLRVAREVLIRHGVQQSIAVCVLRPTLIYGTDGGDSLSRIAAMARRYRLAPIPRPASGLRQPVHCADICDAVAQLMRMPHMTSATIDLPGPDALPFAQMLRRNYEYLAAGSIHITLPVLPLRILQSMVPVAWRSALDRLNEDQVLTGPPEKSLISWAPRHYYG